MHIKKLSLNLSISAVQPPELKIPLLFHYFSLFSIFCHCSPPVRQASPAHPWPRQPSLRRQLALYGSLSGQPIDPAFDMLLRLPGRCPSSSGLQAIFLRASYYGFLFNKPIHGIFILFKPSFPFRLPQNAADDIRRALTDQPPSTIGNSAGATVLSHTRSDSGIYSGKTSCPAHPLKSHPSMAPRNPSSVAQMAR